MRYQVSLLLVGLLFQFWRIPTPIRQVDSPPWQVIYPGIEYREFYLPHPNLVYVARMVRDQPWVTIDSGLAQGKLNGGLETVRDMAARYDQALNYWGGEWGARNLVAVAINGSYFNPDTGVPTGGQFQSGWYIKRFKDLQNVSGFSWTLDRRAFIGGCIVHRPDKQLIFLDRTNKSIPFDGINIPAGKDDLIIYTPQYDTITPVDEEVMDVLVEVSQPLMVLPADTLVNGTVREIRDEGGATPIPFDHIVLSARGKAKNKLKSLFKVGDEIGITQQIRHLEQNCRTASVFRWENTYAGLAGGYYFLVDGVIQGLRDTGAILRNPRTAVAINQEYIYFIVVDGRYRFKSVGMSMVELGVFAKTVLGAVWGMALDGGGSSTIVVRGEVKNKPNVGLSEGGTISGKIIERAVANSLMMVVVLPKEQSTRFRPGDQVTTGEFLGVNLRLGPGTNYGILKVLDANQVGTILDHQGGVNGILAKGSYWWYVDFGEVKGWVAEEFLQSITPP